MAERGQFGVLVDDDDQRGGIRGRFPGAAADGGQPLRAGVQDRGRVAQQRRCLSGVVASRSMHDAHGASSMPCLRSIAQMTTSVQADRLAISTFRPPDLPDPVVPASSACRRRNSTRHGSASSNGPRSTG